MCGRRFGLGSQETRLAHHEGSIQRQAHLWSKGFAGRRRAARDLVADGVGVVHGQVGNAASTSSSGSGDGHDLPKYEVSSVKPSTSELGPALSRLTQDGTSLQNLPLQFLLQQAFGIERDRIIDAPSWVESKRFDIEAKVAPEDAAKLDKVKGADRGRMLIPVLVERFNLKYHHETRELQAYALVPAKVGRNSPKERIFLRPVKPSRQIRRVVREAPLTFLEE